MVRTLGSDPVVISELFSFVIAQPVFYKRLATLLEYTRSMNIGRPLLWH